VRAGPGARKETYSRADAHPVKVVIAVEVRRRKFMGKENSESEVSEHLIGTRPPLSSNR
jgi:hypothetical protein